MTDRAARLRSRLREGPPLLLDGATGTELTRRGVDTALPLWSAEALISAPEIVGEIHRDYRAAGADIITANTFRTHRRSLTAAGLGKRATELTERAVNLAADAIGGPRDGFVAGSMAPLEDCYSPELVPVDGQLRPEHGAMAAALAGAGVDLLLVETMNTGREALIAAHAATSTGLPTIVALVCDRAGNLLSGERVSDVAKRLSELPVDAIAINCTAAPHLQRALQRLAAATALPLGAYANVGYADAAQGWVNTDSVDPAAYCRYAADWLAAGVRLVGSCCGTGPAHTAALRLLIDRDGDLQSSERSAPSERSVSSSGRSAVSARSSDGVP